MAGFQLMTTVALLMLFRLNLKNSLPTNQTTYTTDSEPITTFASVVPTLSKMIMIIPNQKDDAYEGGSLVVYFQKETDIKMLLNDAPSPTDSYQITFTFDKRSMGVDCDDIRHTGIFNTSIDSLVLTSTINLDIDSKPYYMCLRSVSENGKSPFIHQGDGDFKRILVKKKEERTSLLPLWLQIILILILLCMSGLFSGLNLGLMSLDKTELNIMIASGTKKERGYAKKILPLRKRGNYLLCTILLGNVLVNNCLTILLDNLTGSGISAVIASTFAIVLFGEIIPQAVCSRYGLAIGANTLWFTKFFMFITFPLSFPISLILDKILGEELGHVYNRDRLRELLKLTEKDMDLQMDEFNIITGALDLSKKTVKEIMTKIDDVFMIEHNAVLDFDTVTTIMESGFTRVPIYEKERSNIVALLNVKDLALVDPDNRVLLKSVTQFYKHNLIFVFEDTKLNVILSDFKKGGSHMAMVQTIYNEGPGDPYYRVTGLVTLEDVIEEIIQAEIYDEFDTITDNINREPRLLGKKDFSLFQNKAGNNAPTLAPQLKLAVFQYLTANLLPFKPPHVSERILHKLLNQNIVMTNTYNEDLPSYLFQHSRPCDYFVIIVEGRVEVQCGKENLTYEAGPFSYFGTQALLVPSFRVPINDESITFDPVWVLATNPFVPDYSVRVISNIKFLKIRRDQYAVAYYVTKNDTGKVQEKTVLDEIFEQEWLQNNQNYMTDVREDRLRKHLRTSALTTSSFQPRSQSFFATMKRLKESKIMKTKHSVDVENKSFLDYLQHIRNQRSNSDADIKIKQESEHGNAKNLKTDSLQMTVPSQNSPLTTSPSPQLSLAPFINTPTRHESHHESQNNANDNNNGHGRLKKYKSEGTDVHDEEFYHDHELSHLENLAEVCGLRVPKKKASLSVGGRDQGRTKEDDEEEDGHGDESSVGLLNASKVKFGLSDSESTSDTKVVLAGKKDKVEVVKM